MYHFNTDTFCRHECGRQRWMTFWPCELQSYVKTTILFLSGWKNRILHFSAIRTLLSCQGRHVELPFVVYVCCILSLQKAAAEWQESWPSAPSRHKWPSRSQKMLVWRLVLFFRLMSAQETWARFCECGTRNKVRRNEWSWTKKSPAWFLMSTKSFDWVESSENIHTQREQRDSHSYWWPQETATSPQICAEHFQSSQKRPNQTNIWGPTIAAITQNNHFKPGKVSVLKKELPFSFCYLTMLFNHKYFKVSPLLLGPLSF